MTNAKQRQQIFFIMSRSLLITCLFVIASLLSPSPSHAQQSEMLQRLQPVDTQTCKIESRSCGCATCGCNACGSCQSGPSCPSGYTIYDDYCLPECPVGYLRYPGFPGYCMPPCHHGCPEGYEPVPLPNCPQGFHRSLSDPEECLPDRVTHLDNCPDGMGYSLETGRCSPNCPQGTYLAENGLCQSYYERACPDGYQRNAQTGACIPGGDWPDDYRFICMPVCPQGYTRDIYHPTRCVPPPDDCPQGFENFRNQCVPTCEQGSRRNSYGYCVPPRCEDGTYPDLRGNCREYECPQGYSNIRGQCYPPCAQGFTHNLRNPANCEQIPNDEPDCPQGTRLNIQTGNCDRIPPPPVKCKQGLEYNVKTKRCEPPPNRQPACPKGFVKTKSGRCMPIVEQPPTLNVPKACPEGTIYNRKRQRCLPVLNEQVPEFEEDPDEPPPQLNLNNNIQRLPKLQQRCPEDTYMDKNGRCMPIQ